MEATGDQSAAPLKSSGSKLRYPLRSVTKPKDARPEASSTATSSIKRGRPSPSVSKSMNVLNLSAKEKSAKPQRRLSNPNNKSIVSPRPAFLGSVTPISDTRLSKANFQGKNDTPLSEASSTTRRKFSALTSVSYWLAQIKLAESSSKHSVSLGFFKLALESGCEPLQRMREELKSYARRHNLVAELGEPTKDLLQCYNILEDFNQLKVSEPDSEQPETGEQASNEDAALSSATRSGTLKPRSLNSETYSVAESNKKERVQKRSPATKNMASSIKNPVSVTDASGKNARKTPQKLSKVMTNNGNGKIKIPSKTSLNEEVDSVDHLPAKESHEDKENMDILSMEEANIQEEIETH